MRNLSRTLLILIFFLFYSLPTTHYSLLTQDAYAQGEFETQYDVSYSVDLEGKTTVTQNIILKNKTTNNYADKFELKIGSTKVEDARANDQTGPLETQVNFENNLTTITVRFKQRVIGIDKTLPWTLIYTSKELTSKSGQIWELSIPRVGKSSEISKYDAKISVPTSFGPVAFTVPNPKTSKTLGQRQEFTFDKDQLFESGIAISFGSKQVFAFELNYFLENINLTNQIMEISLPPDNNYQKVVLEKIEPQPENVTVNKDGNFLAEYKLTPGQQLDIKASGFVEVFSRPFRNIYQKKLTAEEKSLYTQPQRYWETDNPLIREKASELKNPENIYTFVTRYLNYSQERLNQPEIKRLGAASAFTQPKEAVCMEFTDLFIAIARSAGFPAREVEGYAFTQNERLRPLSLTLSETDVLHAWPEYWDDELGWVQVDPTWGSTSGGLDYFNKLDFNHITFIQRGLSSTTPFPAGAYKKKDESRKKSVRVSFAQELPNPTLTPELNLVAPDKILSGIPVKIKASVKNVGSISLIDETLNISSAKLMPPKRIENPKMSADSLKAQKTIDILPPFSQKDFEFTLTTNSYLQSTNDTIVLSFANTQITKPVKILPIYKVVLFPPLTASIVTALAIMIIGFFIFKKNLIWHSKPRD